MKKIKLTVELEVSNRSPLIDNIALQDYLECMLILPGDSGVLSAKVEELQPTHGTTEKYVPIAVGTQVKFFEELEKDGEGQQCYF